MIRPTDGAQPLERLAQVHYENFPVASLFLPAGIRRPIQLIYAFARVGDDIADEWPQPAAERLQALDAWSAQLHTAVEQGTGAEFFVKLAAEVHRFHLDLGLFDDLIEAFRMDVRHAGFATYQDLLLYCKHSANPIGRLMLQLFGCSTQQNGEFSDTICTALQLANFWQDLFIDTVRQRYYVPEEDRRRFGVTREACKEPHASKNVRDLVRFELDRTKELFETGKPLLTCVPRRFRLELGLIWHGGMRIVHKIERQDYDTLAHRPVLGAIDKLSMLFQAIAS
jgi:squalene synthase HpnC